MVKTTLIPVLTVAAGACTVVAVQAQGYFDFSDIPGVGDTPTVEINLNPEMLGFVTAAAGASGDDDAEQLLAGIEGIRVQVYEDVRDADAVVDFIDEASRRLEAAGWQRAVYIQDDDDERVQMYLQFEAGEVSGMTVMIADGDEAVFINMAGTINPETLGAVSRRMGFGGVLGAFGGGVFAPAPVLARPPVAAPDNGDAD